MEWVAWVEWVEWVEWECNHFYSNKNSKRAVFTALFFILTKIISDEGMVKDLKPLEIISGVIFMI